MPYSFQTFTSGQVLTAAQMNQVEVNARDHIHGKSSVSTPFVGRVVSPVTVQNTTVETDIVSITVPGGTLSTNRFLRWVLWGKLLNNSGGNITFSLRLYYGGTQFSNTQRSTSANASYSGMRQHGHMVAAGATNSQRAMVFSSWATVGTGVDADTGSPLQTFQRIHSTALTIDSTANQTFRVSLQMDVANANGIFVLEGFYLEEDG